MARINNILRIFIESEYYRDIETIWLILGGTMKTKKISIVTFLLILSLIFNGIQYLQVKDLPQVKQEYVDELFRSKIKTAMDGINFLEVETIESCIRNLSYNFNSMAEFYNMTSYYLHNPELKGTLWYMKNTLTLRPYTSPETGQIDPAVKDKKIENLITKEDLRAFYPILEKIFMNPKDKAATQEFDNMISVLSKKLSSEFGYPVAYDHRS